MSAPALSRFLITRGLWLVIVEMTFVLFATTFNLTYSYIAWQVIWAIGCCMISLAVLVHLPWRGLLAFSVVMIAGHNLFDGVRSEDLAQFGWLWKILHEGPSLIQLSAQHMILVIYPLIPWIGVMSAGYCFGHIYDLEEGARRKRLLQLGLGLTMAFVVLRVANIYGDMSPWSVQSTPFMTLASFLRATKYPPSLIYLLMTLDQLFSRCVVLDGISVSARNPFLVFGKVPLFYYVVHWYALHLVAIALAAARYGRFRLSVRAASLRPAVLGGLPSRIRISARHRLRDLGGDRPRALSAVSVVRRRQVAAASRVVELRVVVATRFRVFVENPRGSSVKNRHDEAHVDISWRRAGRRAIPILLWLRHRNPQRGWRRARLLRHHRSNARPWRGRRM
jgi:uncharacterized membrane protein